MKREILFKAKHIHALPENEWMEGKWVEGFLSGEDYINDGTYEYMIDPDTICQYTGLTDKKGRKIWENDIIKYHYGDYYTSVHLFVAIITFLNSLLQIQKPPK